MLANKIYDRDRAVAYASQWALMRNPAYYDYTGVGGDCTNFTSQCIFAGSGVMNRTRTYGWYYNSANDKSASWTGVKYLHSFLTANDGVGPYASETDINGILPGDIIQLGVSETNFYHSLVATSIGKNPTPENTLICTHTFDTYMRPLWSYNYSTVRFLHIEGVRNYV